MKETRKMLKYYKINVKISAIGMVACLVMLIIVAVCLLVFVPQIWWVSLILFGLVIVFAFIFYYTNKATKRRIKELEREIAEAEKSKSE